MLFEELKQKRNQIEELAHNFGARYIHVFGSVVRGEEGDDSDIDFLVGFPEGYDMFEQRMALMDKLSGITGRRVEVIPEHELNPFIKEAVLKEARPL